MNVLLEHRESARKWKVQVDEFWSANLKTVPEDIAEVAEMENREIIEKD